MLKKNNFFKFHLNTSIQYKHNVKKTQKVYKNFLVDLKNNKIPLLQSFEKKYDFDFTKKMIKKFTKYKNIFIIGMGGSVLGSKAIHSFFREKIKKKIFFFDNLDPHQSQEFIKNKNLKSTCFVIISKSGNTLEAILNLGLILSKKKTNKNIVIITTAQNSNLMYVAKKYNIQTIEHKNFIGGRYSVLSETGMFPAELMGLNSKKFKNLNKLLKNKKFTSSLIKNVASIYTLNSNKINNSVILSYDSKLNDLGYWYQQLVAESLGKKKKGINPILSFCPKDHHSLLQLYLDGPRDKFFTFINSSDMQKKTKIEKSFNFEKIKLLNIKNFKFIINSQCSAVKNVFRNKKIPFREITFYKKNEEELGNIFTFFVLETILLSKLMKVNAFNQPSVEQVKSETKKLLN